MSKTNEDLANIDVKFVDHLSTDELEAALV